MSHLRTIWILSGIAIIIVIITHLLLPFWNLTMSLTLFVFLIWFFLIISCLTYTFWYKRQRRDMKILRNRFLFLLPILAVIIYYSYRILTNYHLKYDEIRILNYFIIIWLIISLILNKTILKNKM